MLSALETVRILARPSKRAGAATAATVGAAGSPYKLKPPAIVRAGEQRYLLLGETLELDGDSSEPKYSYTLASTSRPSLSAEAVATSPTTDVQSPRNSGTKRRRRAFALSMEEPTAAARGTFGRLGERQSPIPVEPMLPSIGSLKHRLDLRPRVEDVVVLSDGEDNTVPNYSRAPPRSGRDDGPLQRAAPLPPTASAAGSRSPGGSGVSLFHKRPIDVLHQSFNPSNVVDLTDDLLSAGFPVGMCKDPVGMCEDEPLDLCSSDDDDAGGNHDADIDVGGGNESGAGTGGAEPITFSSRNAADRSRKSEGDGGFRAASPLITPLIGSEPALVLPHAFILPSAAATIGLEDSPVHPAPATTAPCATAVHTKSFINISLPVLPAETREEGKAAAALPAAVQKRARVGPSLRCFLTTTVSYDPVDAMLVTEEVLARGLAPPTDFCDALASALVKSR